VRLPTLVLVLVVAFNLVVLGWHSLSNLCYGVSTAMGCYVLGMREAESKPEGTE
jgi:hypothetical protein